MAYYDENGRITIDENAAKADIQRINRAVEYLESSKKALSALISQASEGKGQTTAAITEKAAELNSKIVDLISKLRDTSDFIHRTVQVYQAKDAQIKAQIDAYGGE